MKPNGSAQFWARVEQKEVAVCWLWKGRLREKRESNRSYGAFSYKNREWPTHRLAYMLNAGVEMLSKDLVVMHTCDVPLCCNPAHLHLGTIKENNRDRDIKGRGRQARGAQHWKVRWTNGQIYALKRAYLSLPRGPAGRIKPGHLEALAAYLQISCASIQSVLRTRGGI